MNSYTRIKGLTEKRRMPRLGKIGMGLRKVTAQGKEYPSETDHFVFDEEDLRRWPKIGETCGENPRELKIMFPAESQDVIFPQANKFYGSTQGLKCKGDGSQEMIGTATRWLCVACGKMACQCKDRRTIETEVTCPCDLLDGRQCKPVGCLMFVLYEVTMAGVWQVDTSSYHSIIDVNSYLDFVRMLCGRVKGVPLVLKRVERVTHGGGHAATHYTLQLAYEGESAAAPLLSAAAAQEQLLIDPPHDDGDECDPIPDDPEAAPPGAAEERGPATAPPAGNGAGGDAHGSPAPSAPLDPADALVPTLEEERAAQVDRIRQGLAGGLQAACAPKSVWAARVAALLKTTFGKTTFDALTGLELERLEGAIDDVDWPNVRIKTPF